MDEAGHSRLGLKLKIKPQPIPLGPCHDQQGIYVFLKELPLYPVGESEKMFLCRVPCPTGYEIEKGEWLPVAPLGASVSRLHPEALELLRGKPVRIVPHGDSAGEDASRRWKNELTRAGCHGDVASLQGLRKRDGSPLKDLNEAVEVHPEDAEEFAQILS